MRAIEAVEKDQVKPRPQMKSGDTVRVHVKVREGDKERIQVFEGIVIGMHRGGTRATFTVRKVSFGQGVERDLPAALADHRPRGRRPVRPGASGEALLPARPEGQGRPDEGNQADGVAPRRDRTRDMPRPRADRAVENGLRRWGFVRIAGADEVGRGCLAGPVMAGVVVLDPDRHIAGLRDSKLLSAASRERLYAEESHATRSAGPLPPWSPPKSIGSTFARPRCWPCGTPSWRSLRSRISCSSMPSRFQTSQWPSAGSSTATPAARRSPPPPSWLRSRGTA